MPLEEYKRKRRFEETPEPPPKVEKSSLHRFVIQRHEATRLHYDFRLELEGVLKSWAVPKGPSLDPADKRLAMQVEDHPVSYFDFEGIIPEGNYGAGTVMVWDVGKWQPLSPKPVQGKFVPGTDAEAVQMLADGDLKIRLQGKKIRGDFALVRMRSRRPGSKGTEWLLIKKKDEHVEEGYDAEQFDESAISGRPMAQIRKEHDAEWKSSKPASRGRVKAAWLADKIAAYEKRKKTTEDTANAGGRTKRAKLTSRENPTVDPKSEKKSRAPVPSAPSVVKGLESPTSRKAPMPAKIQPMLAVAWEKPFNDTQWLFEIKWDGYRAVAFIADGKARLVSRTQNDLTSQFPELAALPKFVKGKSAILDGEIVALDEEGRASFSLMQQRTGFTNAGGRGRRNPAIPILYYAFDLLYLDGSDLRRTKLEERKQLLAEHIDAGDILRYSDHQDGQGVPLYEVARARGLEGILAKCKTSIYEERRSSQWRKIKITQTIDCVIGGYTEPKGSREYFGALVLGLYDRQHRLLHVAQAGTGFDQATQRDIWRQLEKRLIKENPFSGKVEAMSKPHWVKPELVAEIKFGEWTHDTGTGPKLRAPVFLRLRSDKKPQECVLEEKA